MSNDYKTEQRKKIEKGIAILQDCMNNHTNGDINEFFRLKGKMDKLYTELSCLYRPELKGKTCPLCGEKYDGYGNNPAPLVVEGQVCDDCNATRVIPARIVEIRR
jgi:hypothetical protein